MKAMLQDLRYALRQLRKLPGFTLTAVLTLALGIGITAAVYSVVQTVLLEPLPYPDPDSLVGLAFTFPHDPANAEQTGIAADFVSEHVQAFSSVAITDDSGSQVNLSVNNGHALQISALRVSQGYFQTLGVMPALGRGFLTEEDRPGGAKVAVLSDGLWAAVFNRDPSILGRVIRVNQESYTVVGVMPASFAVSSPGLIGTPDLWQPMQLSPSYPGYDGDNFNMVARLRPGVTLAQVQRQFDALKEPFYQQYPRTKKWVSDDRSVHEFRVWKLQEVLVSDVRRSLLTVMCAVLAVLLVACLNLAGLMMARAMRRSREFAVRSALGATRFQMLRLLACEGLLLAFGGGLLALLVTRVAVEVLLHRAPLAIPALHRDTNGWLLLGIVLEIALVSTGIFSMLPAWVILRKQSGEVRLSASSQGETASHARISRTLMVVQIGLAMVLISTASMLLGTFVKLRALPSGIVPRQLTVAQVALKGDRYATTRQTSQFITAVVSQLRNTPGVENAAAINGLPLDRGLNYGGSPEDRPNLDGMIEFRAVTPGYFHTMGVALLAGRDIAETDNAGSVPVVLISATTAKKWWPGRSPIGELIRVGRQHNRRVVGVVADVQMHSLTDTQGIVIYGPVAQLSDEFTGMMNGWFSTSFAIRTRAHVNLAQVVQQAVAQADPEIPVAKLTTMQAVIDDTIQEPRFFWLLATGFSAFALVLTVIGLFGLLSYHVTQRTREIGVRMALGANRWTILRTFLGHGLAIASLGLVLGVGASWLMRPVVSHLLADSGVEISAHDAGHDQVVMNGTEALMFAASAIVIATLAASWLPARRAAAVEPMQALRAE